MHMASSCTRFGTGLRWAVALLFLGIFSVGTRAAVPVGPSVVRRQFDLPADSAEQSLKRLSTQSGLQVIFASDLTDGVRTNPVKGAFTAQEAADLLLVGTALRVIHDDKTGVLSVRRRSNPERDSPEKKAERASLTMACDRPTQPSPTRPSTILPKT